MNVVVKYILDKVVKPEMDRLVADLVATRDMNIAILSAQIQGGAVLASAAVEKLVSEAIAKYPALEVAAVFVQPELSKLNAQLETLQATDIPTLYDKAVEWLKKEEAYL